MGEVAWTSNRLPIRGCKAALQLAVPLDNLTEATLYFWEDDASSLFRASKLPNIDVE